MPKRRRRKKAFPRVTREELRTLIKLLARRPQQSPTAHAYQVSQAVIRKFLGLEWVQTHIWTSTTGYIRPDTSSALARETYYMRTTLLAEMLYNLQIVKGFDNCLTELKGGQIESAYAALEIARLLCTQATDRGLTFYFVTPRRGRSYDLYITLSDGVTVRAEIKCKQEETDISLRTIKESLQHAKKYQLPKTRPGVIFVKVPRHWLDARFAEDLERLTDRFFRNTGRVVSVKFYTAEVTYRRDFLGETIGEVIQYKEHSNPHHRFAKLRDYKWTLFSENPPPGPPERMSYNGLPRAWQRWFSP
jgi:hypothetical protein